MTPLSAVALLIVLSVTGCSRSHGSDAESQCAQRAATIARRLEIIVKDAGSGAESLVADSVAAQALADVGRRVSLAYGEINLRIGSVVCSEATQMPIAGVLAASAGSTLLFEFPVRFTDDQGTLQLTPETVCELVTALGDTCQQPS